MIHQVRRQPVQIRRHRQCRHSLSRQRIRQRLRRCHSPHRRPAPAPTRSLRQPDDRHLAVTVLAPLRRFDLARRRGPHVRRRRSATASTGSPTATAIPTRRRPGRPALSDQLAHAARHHLRPHNKNLNTDPGNDFRNEVRSYFGTGTQLQEMYITPSLLTDAKLGRPCRGRTWSRANADVLRDTHWIGGDPPG